MSLQLLEVTNGFNFGGFAVGLFEPDEPSRISVVDATMGIQIRLIASPRATPAQKAANDLARTAPCNVERINHLGEDYDEYPFQVPAQGVASGQRKINWDIRMVNSAHNQLVGSKLNTLSKIERGWYGDHFYVQVVG